jgi:hypothetical protein
MIETYGLGRDGTLTPGEYQLVRCNVVIPVTYGQ